MHRRLALAAALLGDPGTLLLDGPTEGLSPRNVEWFHFFLRSFAVAGGTVLVTTRTPQEASQLADRVVTLDHGRLVADQPVAEFRRTRLSREVAVRGPQMARLADLLVSQGAEVRRDGSVGLAVAGIDRTEIGELAYRHGILLHELADRVVEQPAPRVVLPTASGRSGHLRVRPAAEAEPGPDPAAEPVTVPVPVVAPGIERVPAPVTEPGAPTAREPEPVPDTEAATTPQRRAPRRQGDASLPTRALPVAVVAAALPALGSPVPGTPAPRLAEPGQVGAAIEPAPTVAVDRLFRDDLLPAADSARVRTRGRHESTDLLADDTVRLRRLTSGATAASTAASAASSAPSSAPATTDDHRSE